MPRVPATLDDGEYHCRDARENYYKVMQRLCQRPNGWIEFMIYASSHPNIPRNIRDRAELYQSLKRKGTLFGREARPLCERVLRRQGGAENLPLSMRTPAPRTPTRPPRPPVTTPQAPRRQPTRERIAASVHVLPPLVSSRARRVLIPNAGRVSSISELPFSLNGFSDETVSRAERLVSDGALAPAPLQYQVGPVLSGLAVQRQDMLTLRHQENISDDIVNGMYTLITREVPNAFAIRLVAYSLATHYQNGPLLCADHPNAVSGRLQAYTMNAVIQFLPQQPQRWIFVPINQANYHWVLVVYDALERTLTGYDPLFRTMTDELNNVERILWDGGILEGPVEKINGTDMPRQTDSINCGPAIIVYMLAISRTQLLPQLSAQVQRLIRTYVACCIFSNTLAYTGQGTVAPGRGVVNMTTNSIGVSDMVLTRAQQRASFPALLDETSGAWILGRAVPDIVYDYDSNGNAAEEKVLSFGAPGRWVMMTFRQWEAQLLSDVWSPQPNPYDIEALIKLLSAVPCHPTCQSLLHKLTTGVCRQSFQYLTVGLDLFRTLLVNNRDDLIKIRQMLKSTFFAALFFRRWKGPGNPYPYNGRSTYQLLAEPNLADCIPERHRMIVDERADGMATVLLRNVLSLYQSLSRAASREFAKLPIVNLANGVDPNEIVPAPMVRSPLTSLASSTLTHCCKPYNSPQKVATV
jgi:hypothetical protein